MTKKCKNEVCSLTTENIELKVGGSRWRGDKHVTPHKLRRLNLASKKGKKILNNFNCVITPLKLWSWLSVLLLLFLFVVAFVAVIFLGKKMWPKMILVKKI